jgi:hypothetical protein
VQPHIHALCNDSCSDNLSSVFLTKNQGSCYNHNWIPRLFNTLHLTGVATDFPSPSLPVLLIIYIFFLTAIGLPPGGSSTVHIYTQTIHRKAQNKQYIKQHKNFWKSVWSMPHLCKLYHGICLQLRKKHRKTSVRVAKECQLARWGYINTQ